MELAQGLEGSQEAFPHQFRPNATTR